ncbi:hypothetical protein SUGI_0332870 [Cryptomeria japonica]|nr:hypothetical protein SUGI_0332870 [Cryptomeria japonica]
MPDGMKNDVEYVAPIAGLTLCKEKGMINLDVKGDSLNIICAIITVNAPSWKSGMWLEGIYEILKALGEYNIRHVYREANTEANFLSKHAINKSEMSIIFYGSWALDGFNLAMGLGE